MKTLKLVPSTPDFKFVRYNRRAFVVSSCVDYRVTGGVFDARLEFRHRLQGRYSG